MSQLAKESYNNNQHNVSFLSSYLLGDLQQCLEILIENGRIPEATFFAHTYAPSQVPRLVSLWRDAASQSLSGISKRVIKSKFVCLKKFFYSECWRKFG